ncbi:MAG: family 20 glycosylhydrolase, partial [Bacteroidales bacterium]|nr:family 20 glycosylhydrolase [Bacteroidales bacterium]
QEGWDYFPNRPRGKPAYGGYFSQQELKGLVQYALERNIEIIPEIEMPGHSWAALYAYPKLSCSGVPFKKPSGVPFAFTDPFCAGNPYTYAFLEDVLDEVMAVFPSKYIHIGGDEAKHTPWETCAKCQQLAKKQNIADMNGLQGYFMDRMANYLISKGRTPMGWDEITHSNVSKEVIITSWQNIGAVKQALDMGYKTVLCPSDYLYFDKYQHGPQLETTSMSGIISLDTAYMFNIGSQSTSILGIQGCLWTEHVPNAQKAFTQLLPRMLAVAELGWHHPATKLLPAFRQKVSKHFGMLNTLGYNCFIEPPVVYPLITDFFRCCPYRNTQPLGQWHHFLPVAGHRRIYGVCPALCPNQQQPVRDLHRFWEQPAQHRQQNTI